MRRTQLRQSEVVVDISLIFHVLMMSDVQKGLLPAVSSISVLYPKICNPVPLKIFFPFFDFYGKVPSYVLRMKALRMKAPSYDWKYVQ